MLLRLEALLRASPQVTAFHVIDNDPIDAENFLLKIRCEFISGQTLQIRLRAVAGHIRYSYQEFIDKPFQRAWPGVGGDLLGAGASLIPGPVP